MAGTSYTRQSSLTDGDTITASLFNDEYNQLVNAFAYAAAGSTGHQHDGGAGEGGNIEIIGDQDFKNKIIVDSTNNRWSVFVEVGGTAVEQVRIEDGVVYPVTDSDVDLGTDTLRFKNAYIDSLTATGNLTVGGNITVTGNVDVDGIVEFDGLSGTGAVTVTNILDEDNMSSNSATALVTQQSIKAYVDAQVTAQDLDLTDGTTTIAIDLDSEALSVLGGTGVTSTASGNGVTLAIDSTVTTLTGTQTLTNKTLTTPAISGNLTTDGNIDGRDVAADGTKLDTVETNSDVTDTANVTAAGALMDSELTSIASVKALNQGVATTDSPTFAAATVTGEITANGGIALGDNDKATFGAGYDLQIYHDGATSYIDDSGTGNLVIKSEDFYVYGSATLEPKIRAITNAEVGLYYNGLEKLATTSTGIDVTGSVVADGLSVEGNTQVNSASAAASGTRSIQFYRDSAERGAVRFDYSASTMELQADGNFFVSTGGESTRLFVNNNGDISFYEDTGTTAKLFWDASAESLGIGTSSPNVNLEILSGGTFTGAIRVGDSGSSRRLILEQTDVLTYTIGGTGTNSVTRFVSGGSAGIGSERMRIDSSGNVGIGTDSPSQDLEINKNASNVNLNIRSSDTGSATLLFGDQSDASMSSITQDNSSNALIFKNNNQQERMRIDSSGNLLVGKTATAIETVGINLFGTGRIISTADGDDVAVLNRKTSDGDIAVFKKDGTSVGSIGSSNSDLTIGNSDVGLKFHDVNNIIYPWNVSTDTASDGLLGLGSSSVRFKDAYLSGGVYLGGTGAANKLEDYEEGTWTPTAATIGISGNLGARYTKIGNLVTLTCQVIFGSSASTDIILIGGIPFAASATQAQSSSGVMHNSVTLTGGRTSLHTYITNNNTAIGFYESGSGLTYQGVTINNMSASSIVLNIQYMTDS